ncbi:hypothetical protein LPB85_04865 [Chryseobacterium sp. LC2016-27]|jgi:hypothetical protein|uniref:hypothetical protein n=1 Tax=Chryseobacterium sp. LC2016-27 TaxID=2897326 RepID=UPI001E3B175F|nr:hypothetical protein [Chryseobacterium sp. LC2016-27]MCD0454776.1 hypothetical protein [Chryseobacterium sp. LC2016-27]
MITRNNIMTTAAVLFMGTLLISGQVAIGKGSVSNSSVSLEFAETQNRGMILPWVTSVGAVTGVVDGSFVYDLSDHKVKVKYAAGWKDLSVDLTGATGTAVQIQNDATENPDAKVSIGAPTTAAPAAGILVLEDQTKAMVLPRVASPHLNIIDPAAGMMVYDTTAKQLAVFNGTVWSFWKP